MPIICPPPLTALCITSAFAALRAVGAAPTCVQQPLTVSEMPELHGYLGERRRANRANYLHSFDIEKYTQPVETVTIRLKSPKTNVAGGVFAVLME